MPTPFDDLLTHTANLYRYAPGQDADAGASGGYATSLGTDVPCSVQKDSAEIGYPLDRTTMINIYTVFLPPAFNNLQPKDAIDWTDADGVPRPRLYVAGPCDFGDVGGLVEYTAMDRA